MVLINNLHQSRRLQLSGGSTYIISLPKTWMQDMRVKVGDAITLVKNSNNSLTFFPSSGFEYNEKQQCTINISQKDSDEGISRKVIAAYLGGYKIIIIKTKGIRIQPNHSKLIRNLVRKSIMGTEIVESSSESIVIQVLTRLPDLSFETALKRMHLMVTTMHREAMDALSKNDKNHGEEIAFMDDEVDRFSLYTLRNLSIAVQNANVLLDMGLNNPSDCLGYRTVISRIERIGDHAALIAKRIRFVDESIEPKTMKKLSKLSDDSLNVFDGAIDALLKKDYLLAERVADEIKSVIETEKQIMSSISDTKNETIIKFVLDDIRRTAEYSSDIVEVAIDENIHNLIAEN